MLKLKVNSCDGVYDSLDVRLTKVCDNNCKFCIEKDGLDSLGATNIEKMVKTTIESGKKDILVLGGEPLINPQLALDYIRGIRTSVDTIYLTTSLPKVITYGSGLETFKEILTLLDGVNISIHHHTNDINNKVLDSNNPHNRIDFLAKMLKDEDFARKARICCNLVNGFIDSKKEIDGFIAKMSEIGVKHIKLNELQNVDINTYVSFEEVYSEKMKSPFSHGCQTDISDMFERFKIKITLKRSCFCNKDSSIAKATIGDLYKCFLKRVNSNLNCQNFKVLYENGTLADGWKKQKSQEPV